MRLVSYGPAGRLRSGVQLHDGSVVDTYCLAAALRLPEPIVEKCRTNRGVVGLNSEIIATLHQLAVEAHTHVGLMVHPAGSVHLGPPIADPEKIICVGLNYTDHAAEVGAAAPPSPMYFAKYANSLTGPNDPIVPPRATNKVDYEAELAIVIGAAGRYIDLENALEHVWGAMALNDLSARDMQLANQLWTSGKAVDTFAPCGPALVSLDELGDIQNLTVTAHVNGDLVQSGTTASMIFDIPTLVAFISESMTLQPGDIIATGTPAGVGQSKTPPLFLQSGDVVDVSVERVGTISNQVQPAATHTNQGTGVS